MCFDIGSRHLGAKTRLHTPKAVTYHEQSQIMNHTSALILKFTPHCICRPGDDDEDDDINLDVKSNATLRWLSKARVDRVGVGTGVGTLRWLSKARVDRVGV
jgi:hypothetical protein